MRLRRKGGRLERRRARALLGLQWRQKEGGEIREEGENWRWEWIAMGSGSLSLGLPARGGGQAGAQVRGRAVVRGGHLLLPTGGGGRRQELLGRARLGDR